jgi:cell division protein FtsB
MGKTRLTLYFGIGAAVLTALFLPGFSQLQELKAERELYRKRISLLEEYNVALQEEIEKMREDPLYIEKKARDKLGIVRKGEVVYRRETP